MQYRTIGKTGLRVSEIGFGCGNNAVLMVKAPHEDQVKSVRHALDAGINFFDTAFAYGLGKSEENLGKILSELGAQPVISTKIRLEPDALGDPKALHELVDSGEFHGFQCYYNLLNPSAGQPVPKNFSALDYGQILDRAAAKGMGAFVIRILAAGALTSDPSTGGGGSGQTLSPGSDYPVDLQRAEKIKAALSVEGRDLTQAAIRFGLMNQKVSVVLVGFSNTTHIDEAVACSGMPGLSDGQMAKVRKLWDTDFEQVV